MVADDDDLSLSSASSSSSEQSASTDGGDSLGKDPTEDGCENCWRQSVFASVCVLGATVIFTTVILMLGEDNEHFENTVSYLDLWLLVVPLNHLH